MAMSGLSRVRTELFYLLIIPSLAPHPGVTPHAMRVAQHKSPMRLNSHRSIRRQEPSRRVAFHGDLKDNVGAFPLALVFDKVKSGIRYMPYDFLSRYQFGDLLSAAVKIFVVELKLSTEFVGTTVNFF